ncbi:TonB-dependent receptor [Balneolales bacterium ANBcel1]|nr:TonB-dependent receptor [Balneolales bacterium ANBcel1]
MRFTNASNHSAGIAKAAACFILMLLLGASDMYAQTTGRVTGRVLEEGTGEPLTGVNIHLQGTTIGAVTDLEGYYTIINIAPDEYTVVASMIGFTTQRVEEVRVHMNQTEHIDFTMSMSAYEGEEVVLTAQRQRVQMELSQSRTLVDARAISDSPVSNLEEMLSTFPGISLTSGADGSGLVIRGGNINETNIFVDGLSTRDMRTQQPNTTLNLTAVNELEVMSGGFTADHGGIRSGMVTIVTRDGRLDKYDLIVDYRISPPQKKHFGPSPYHLDGPFWQVYAGPDAMTGVTREMVDTGEYPFTFVGWNEVSRSRLADGNPETDVNPQEALEIWKWQHRHREYANKPDHVLDMTLTGPVPFLGNTTFMASQRYDDLQLAYPLSRNNSISSSTLFKLTSHLGGGKRLSWNHGYLLNKGVSAGQYGYSVGMVNGTRQGTSFARNALEEHGLWHDATLNPIETRHYRTGLELNHAISSNTFYQVSVDFTTYSTRQEPIGVRNTDCIKQIGTRCYDEGPFGYVSSDIGRIGEQYDILDQFLMSGGGRGRDNSNYWTIGTSFDYTSQIDRRNQLKFGFAIEYADYRERREVNHGLSTQPYEEAPQNWTRFDATPVNASAYITNRFELGGMIANVGVRADYMWYGDESYNLDPDFIFNNLPYSTGSFQDNELSFSHLQTGNVVSKLYLSPRIGVSHPITTTSKVFFNYGHFYQPPVLDQIYRVQPQTRGAIIPNMEADWPRTISYELGFEVEVARRYLATFTTYYKDVSNQLSLQNIVSWDEENNVQTHENNSYADIRGVELRLQKVEGEWFRGWAAFEYSGSSSGFTGFRYVYEDPLRAREQRETIQDARSTPTPSITANLTFSIPPDVGPTVLGNKILGGWRLNVNQSWSDGGEYLLNPEARVGQRRYVDVIDYWNTDVQLSKDFNITGQTVSFYAQVTNLTNYRGFPNPRNMTQYRESLRFPWYSGERQGNDKWGEWDKDHIVLGYNTWEQFINPRHFSFGFRIHL